MIVRKDLKGRLSLYMVANKCGDLPVRVSHAARHGAGTPMKADRGVGQDTNSSSNPSV